MSLSEPSFRPAGLGGGCRSRVSTAYVLRWTPNAISAPTDRAEFEALFRELHGPLVRYARSLSSSGGEDAVQDAFVTLWRRRAALDPTQSVRALLYTAVRNVLLNRSRDARRRDELHGTMAAPDAPHQPDQEASAALLSAHVRKAVQALPDRQREAFGLTRFDGLSYAEVAAVMGCSVKTVENHVGRALRALRDHLLRVAPDALLS